MKKHRLPRILLISILFLSTNAFAQRFSAGVEAGYSIASYSDQSGTTNLGTGNINTFQLGGIAEYNLGAGFFAQSGLSFSQKGTTQFPTNGNTGTTSTIKISYLQIPLNIEYKISFKKDWKAIIGTGFYIARGLSGTEVGSDYEVGGTTVINRSVHFTTDNTTNNSYTSANPYDFGYNLFLGVEYKHFQVKASLNNGFSKVLSQGDTRFQNQVTNISASYLWPLK